jgi:hypothetical protein
MTTYFSYYYIQHKDGKITDLIKSDSRTEPVATNGAKTVHATANEYNLFKAVDKDVQYAKQIIEDWEALLNNDVP